MMTVGVLLFVVCVILAFASYIFFENNHERLAAWCGIICIFLWITGILLCVLSPRDDRHVIECSEYSVVDQKNLTIQDGDTVETVKHFIYYK